MSRKFRPFADLNDATELEREERREKVLGYCVGLLCFLIVLAVVGTFLYELAMAVMGK